MNTPSALIEITIAINDLYRESCSLFFQGLGCKVRDLKKEILSTHLYCITFPPDTQRECREQNGISRFKLLLSSGIEVEEVRVRGKNYSYLFIDLCI